MTKKQIEVEVQKTLDNGDVLLTNGVSMTRMMAIHLGIIEDAVYELAKARGKVLKESLGAEPIGIDDSTQCTRCGEPISQHVGSSEYVGLHCADGKPAPKNEWLLGRNLDEYKRGVGRKDYPALAEAFRRNIELGMGLLEMRQHKSGETYPVFSESIRNEAEALIKENLLKLRSLTT